MTRRTDPLACLRQLAAYHPSYFALGGMASQLQGWPKTFDSKLAAIPLTFYFASSFSEPKWIWRVGLAETHKTSKISFSDSVLANETIKETRLELKDLTVAHAHACAAFVRSTVGSQIFQGP